MNSEPSSLFALAPKRLQWLAARQKSISENIANADVAGYKARDVQSFASYLDSRDSGGAATDIQEIEARVGWDVDMSGNNVVLEEQIIEANSNAGQFRLASSLYRKAHEMLYAVAGRR